MCDVTLPRTGCNNLHAGRSGNDGGRHSASAGGYRVVAHAAELGRATGIHDACICADGIWRDLRGAAVVYRLERRDAAAGLKIRRARPIARPGLACIFPFCDGQSGIAALRQVLFTQ